MGAAGISSARQRSPRGFMALLSSAACEWFLIFLLFVDAALSYLLTRFAHYCDLQTPCLLCSRLDHVFGKKKSGHYQTLLCSNHREEISSLVCCHVHGNLADVRGMCEECFVSLAAENRLTLNKTWMDRFSSKNGSLGPWTCSCCNKSWKARSSAQKLVQLTPVGFGASKATVKPPLPRAPGHSRFSRRDSFKKIRDKISGPMSPCSPGKIEFDRISGSMSPCSPGRIGFDRIFGPTSPCSPGRIGFDKIFGPMSPCSPGKIGVDKFSVPMSAFSPGKTRVDKISGGKNKVDNLSHVGYTELNFNSDSESEVPFSDDEDGYYGLCRPNHCNAETGRHPVKTLMKKSPTDDVALDKTLQSSEFGLDQPMQLNSNKRNNLKSLKSKHGLGEIDWDSFIKCGLGEIDWEQFSPKPRPPIMRKVWSSSDMPRLSGLSEVPCASGEVSKPNTFHFNMSGLSLPSVCTSLTNLPSSSASMKIPENLNVTDNTHKGHNSVIKNTSTTADSPDESASVIPNHMKPVDPSAVSYRDSEISHVPADQVVSRGTTKTEDAKPSLPVSASDIDFPKYTSARVHSHHDDIQKNDAGSESMDGFVVSEIEGESMVERLKRQVEHDRKALKDLCKELEEERNAAAIAANQAMAMITRLQEEKAALHMEALQYLRMMEEQAEYDVEALEKANDLLAEKEKEMQDLEVQLESYRKMQHQESVIPDQQKEDSKLKGSKDIVENHTVAQVENNHISTL